MMRRLRRLLGNGDLAHSSAQTVASVALGIVLSLATGVMTARLLGADGRGQLAAIVTVNQTFGWIIAIGCFQAVVYHCSRDRESASDVVASWIAIAIPAGFIGVVVAELLLSTLFRAQSPETLHLARIWVLLMPLNPLSEALSGALVADRDFATTNSLRILQGVISVAMLTFFWVSGLLTVTTALIAQATVVIVYIVLLFARVQRRVGIGRPRRAHAVSGLWFALRAHTANVSGQVNARFDMTIMPAFLPAAQIGLYSVAASAAGMIITLASSLCQIVQPVAATAGGDGDRSVAKMFHATILLGVCVAAPVALLAPWLLTLVYSSEFSGAAPALRILAPGAVLMAMANVLISGLFGKNRPATGGFAQLPGAVFMVVTLLLFLSTGGIELAALVSTITYGITVVIASVAYLRFSTTSARELFDVRETAGEIARRVAWRPRRAPVAVAEAGAEP